MPGSADAADAPDSAPAPDVADTPESAPAQAAPGGLAGFAGFAGFAAAGFGEPPAAAVALAGAWTRGAPLLPVATIDTERTTRLLLDAAGGVLAEVADDAVHARALPPAAAPGPDTAVAWREIEVELVDGGPKLIDATSAVLRAAGARPGESPSKLARVLRDRIVPSAAAKARAEARAETRAGNDQAGDALLAYLAAQVDSLLLHDPSARLGDVEGVHRMRVATRRIRSVLATSADVFDRARVGPLRGELRWLAAVLGDVRDLDVLTAHLADAADFAQAATDARQHLNDALGSPRYFALLDALDALHANPPLGPAATRPAATELHRAVRRAWRRLERRHAALAAAPDATTRDAALHELRKAAKRVRYATEPAKDVGDAADRRTARRAGKAALRFQTVLGEHQDAVGARERLRALALTGTPERAFELGVLYGAEERRAEKARKRFVKAWAHRPHVP